MLKTILVPIGDTRHSKSAILQAAILSKATAARVHLLGLVQHHSAESVHQFSDPVSWNATINHKQADVAELASRFRSQQIPVEIAMLDAFTDDTFVRYIDDRDFDLVIFSEKDHVTRALMRYTITHASAPVYVARREKPLRFQRILVPLDTSQRAECVLSLATTLAQATDATLLLTHVIRPPDMSGRNPSTTEDTQLANQIIQRNRREAERYLEDLSRRLTVSTEAHITVDNSVSSTLHKLIKQQQADLVILSAHGFSGRPDQAMGSITSNMMNYCPASFIVLQDLPERLPAIEAAMTGRFSGVQ